MPSINRRHFLMLSAAGLLLPRRAHAATGKTAIIVGAGAAGLSAARTFLLKGITPIVLEARDRVGGRIVTDRTWPDCPVDLGASWIHGIDDNPVAKIARLAHLRLVRTTYDDAIIRHADGSEPTADELTRYDHVLNAVSDLVDNAADSCAIPDSSLAKFTRISEGDSLDLNDPITRLALFDSLGGDWGADYADLSACRIGDDEETGGEEVMFKDGYDGVPKHLAEGVDVRLGTTVTAISLTAAGVKVTSSAGTLEADYAIVTTPLALLKQGTIRFDPGLPDDHLGAIERIGLGVLGKTFLRFPKVFWDDVSGIGRIAPASDGFFEFYNINRIQNAPVLLSFTAGSFAREMDAASDADVQAALNDCVKGLYGNATPASTGLLRARWSQDPLAAMTYSMPAIGMGEDDREILSSPIEGRLAIAGEATHSLYPATVHGAVMSGMEAVEALLEG